MAARHEVDVFTLADKGDMGHRSALAKYCERLTVMQTRSELAQRLRAVPHLFTRTPLTVPYFYSAELAAEVRKAIRMRSYDRIFVYCSAMAQYVQFVDQIPIVMDLVDVDSDKWAQYSTYKRFPLSFIYGREARTLREYEREVCDKSAAVIVTTEREAQLAREIPVATCVHVIPNGVNIDYFDPAAVPPESGPPTVVFTGDMSYFPNIDAVIYFARKVLPLIRESIADVRFLIVGRNPSQDVKQLQEIAGVEVTGFVPDVRTYLAKAQVAVAPFSIAAGIQNKILEAMAYGVPVVATPHATRGLSPAVAELVDTGTTAEQLAAKVVLLLRDSSFARRTGLESRRRVADHYRWDQALEMLLQLLENPRVTELGQTKPVCIPS